MPNKVAEFVWTYYIKLKSLNLTSYPFLNGESILEGVLSVTCERKSEDILFRNLVDKGWFLPKLKSYFLKGDKKEEEDLLTAGYQVAPLYTRFSE